MTRETQLAIIVIIGVGLFLWLAHAIRPAGRRLLGLEPDEDE